MKQQLGRVVVITGAAGGIGRALVDLFATGGDTVVAVDLPDSGVLEMARHLGYPHLCLECDVSRQEDILSLYSRIEERFLHIDVLVNNAAVGPDLVATSNTHVEDFQLTLRVNLVGPNIMARETARRMKPGGVIANVASVAGLLANPHRNAYAASKAGLIATTKVLACEWAPRGIRVCAVAPGSLYGLLLNPCPVQPGNEQIELLRGHADCAVLYRRENELAAFQPLRR
ncbi:NAD(P)-dependent dehydrogenase (short-subunit alcohol dehydrogenase family) [Rhizobium ruizarguesonis]